MLTGFQDFLSSNKIYRPDEILDVLKLVRPNFRFSYLNKSQKYFNVPAAFDIETSSFYRPAADGSGEKVAIMYEWTFGLYGAVIVGREWDEFTSMLATLARALDLNEHKRLIVYVHNLAHEFQFFRFWTDWSKVFALDNRNPVYAITTDWIEFRCSYILSGYSLAKVGDGLRVYPVRKLVGNLDYTKIRHSKTPLTPDELAYCANDVRVVMAYIAETMERDGGLAKLPLTKTGYVRTYCRNQCFYEDGVSHNKSLKRLRYIEMMRGLCLEVNEYKQLKRGFQGGFVHANAFCSGLVQHDVTSIDFTSSYTATMLADQFPMSTGELVEIRSKEEFERNLRLYCCLFDCEITGLETKRWQENYLSESRCRDVENAVVNNGRIVRADHLITTITDVDYMILKQFYSWEHFRVSNFRRYKRGYLPTDFVKSILELYADKTTLKGVEGKESEYQHAKEMLNSCYGMAVTDIVREQYPYEDDWLDPVSPDYDDAIAKYNNSPSRFLFYPWGVWVTAYARRNLYTAILEFGEDYIYSDTDSVKVTNFDAHKAYVRRYNDTIRAALVRAMEYHGIDPAAIEPSTIDGKRKCLGVWDFDGHYTDFKTLGAKRYLVHYSDNPRNPPSKRGKYSLTVSGLNKRACIPYLLDTYGEGGIMEAFDQDMYIPPAYTGKLTHTYIDDVREGDVVDYLGDTGHYYERSAVHLEPADYTLSISREYSDYLLDVKTIEV